MSGRGGIYTGPNGEQLHGDGKPVASPCSELAAPAGSADDLVSLLHKCDELVENTTLKAQLAELQSQVTTLQAKLIDEVTNHRKTLADWKTHTATLRDENATLCAEVERLQGVCRDHAEERELRKQEIAELKAELVRYKAVVAEAEKLYENLSLKGGSNDRLCIALAALKSGSD